MSVRWSDHSRYRAVLLVAAMLPSASSWAQQPAEVPPVPSPTPAPPALATMAPSRPAPADAASEEYKVGSGDVLEVAVIGNDEASRVTTIGPSGTVTLPLIGEVSVAGLTVAEVRHKLTELLAKDFIVNPQVDVRVKEYGSQSALAVGELRSPGRRPLRANTRLIDLLMDAGGFTPQASGEVVVTRIDGTFADRTKTLRVKVATTTPTPQDRAALETRLRNGDIVVAAPKAYVIVEGEVNRPGRFPIEGNLTISGAISMGGGLTRYGSSTVKLRRTSSTGKTEILSINLKEIRKGRQKDVVMQADDVVSVPRKLF